MPLSSSRPAAPSRVVVAAALAAAALTAAAQTTLPPSSSGYDPVAPSTTPAGAAAGTADAGFDAGPVRLRQTPQSSNPGVDAYGRPRDPRAVDARGFADTADGQAFDRFGRPLRARPPLPESDFEAYVRTLPDGEFVQRYGAELLQSTASGARASGVGLGAASATLVPPTTAPDPNELDNPVVPPDYVVRPGDEVNVVLWGSVDADLRLRVDRSGRIAIPRVGPVMVAGVRFAELNDTIARRVAQTFKNFQVSTGLGQLRGQRVFVTGFVRRPGPIVVGNLATLAQALLQAGGPAANGSFRSIRLQRGKQTVGVFDLYDLLQRGDRGSDFVLQPDDVIHVDAVGKQVALIGSVNRAAIFELKPGETLADLIRMAGGFSAVADPGRLVRESLAERNAGRVQPLRLPQDAGASLAAGDVIRAFNVAELFLPTERQNKRVRVDGEVVAPGDYVLPPTATLADAVAAAGGYSAKAYVFGTTFTRESVRREQQLNYERAIRDFETQLTTNAATRRTTNAEEAAAVTASATNIDRLIFQLRQVRPNGRVVLQMTPGSEALPPMVVEDGDRLTVPQRPTTVGVYGSVFSAGSYLHDPGRSVDDYLRLAGGPRRGADEASVFVIRANGTVQSSLQDSGWFKRGNQLAGARVEPGDTIFVPEEMNKSTFVQNAKDWTQILYQFGLGVAGVVAATR